MKKRPSFGLRLPALALAACAILSCESHEHATILRHGETLSAPGVAAVPAAVCNDAEEPMPAEHYRFRCMASYPGTHRTWKNESLMRAPGERRVLIHLGTQRGELLVNGQVAMDFPVSTGKQDSTPEGTYHILEKDPHHRSNIYHVSMPYFMRLTYDGIGLHVGDVYRTPVSHGCIRMTRKACAPLFRLLPVGTEVVVTRG